MSDSLRILKALIRNWYVFVVVITVALFFTNRYLKYAVPMYESTAKIKLAEANEGTPSTNLYKDFDLFAQTNKIGTEVEVLKSEILLERIIDSLNLNYQVYRIGTIKKTELFYDCPFIAIFQPNAELKDDIIFKVKVLNSSEYEISLPDSSAPIKTNFNSPLVTKKGMILLQQNLKLFHDKPEIMLIGNYELKVRTRTGLIKELESNLDVTPVDKDVPVLRISYQSTIPTKSAAIVNTISNIYVQDFIFSRVLAADITVKFLNKQIDSIDSKLSNSENNIQSYRDQNKIINTRQETETDLRKVSEMKIQASNLRMTIDAVQKLYDYLLTNDKNALDVAPNFQAFNDLLSTEMVKNIKELQIKRRDLLLDYTTEDEKVKVIDDKIKDYIAYIKESVKNSLIDYQTKYSRLEDEIFEAQQVFNTLPVKEKTLNILQRSFNLNEQTYNFLQQKNTEAEIARAAAISFHRIIQYGEVAKNPVSPNPSLLKALAIFLSILFSALGIYLVSAIRGSVGDESLIYKNSDTKVLQSIPYIADAENLNDFFKKWFIELDFNNTIKKHDSIAISSMHTNEGKRSVAFGIANAAEQLGKKVLYVSMDKRSTHNFNHLQVIHIDSITENWKIPHIFDELLSKWKSENDLVIIQNSSLKENSNCMLSLRSVDVNLFVLDSRYSKLSFVKQVDDIKEKMNLQNFYYIVNRAGYSPSIFSKAKTIFKQTKRLRIK
ncbi:MAG: tyrosine-protein kinase involved in exopolysaccharide biosynthesis [Bacteroidota bacterium]